MAIFPNQEDANKFLNFVMGIMSKQENVLAVSLVLPTRMGYALTKIVRIQVQMDVQHAKPALNPTLMVSVRLQMKIVCKVSMEDVKNVKQGSTLI